MRSQGGFNRVRVDRTGERHRGFVVLGLAPRRYDELTWSCRCTACGETFLIPSRHMATKIRNGQGCGCRSKTWLRTLTQQMGKP